MRRTGSGPGRRECRDRPRQILFKSGLCFLSASLPCADYVTGIGSYNSTVAGNIPVSGRLATLRLLGFPNQVENDAGAQSHGTEGSRLNVVVGLSCCAHCFSALSEEVYTAAAVTIRLRRITGLRCPSVFEMTRFAISSGLPDIFFRAVNWWSILYIPLPILACLDFLLGIGGLFRGTPAGRDDGPAIDNAGISGVSRGMVLYLPLLMAAWIVVAMMFVAFIPEVV